MKVRSKLSRRLREAQTTSPERRQYLQKLARVMTSEYNPEVVFSSVKTADCRPYEGDMLIRIGNDIHDQSVTNFSRLKWTLIAQKGYLIHELGHVLYTDFDKMNEVKSRCDSMEDKKILHRVVLNPAEDAAIEEQLRRKFNCADEMDVLNANLFNSSEARHKYPVNLLNAVKSVILEKGCYDTGLLEAWQDGQIDLVKGRNKEDLREIVPMIDDMLADVMTEPDPSCRYERMWRFWENLQDYRDSFSEDFDENADTELKPNDSDGESSSQQADELDELDSDQVRVQISLDEQDDEPEESEEDADGGGIDTEGEEDDEDVSEGSQGGGEPEDSEEGHSPTDEEGDQQDGSTDGQSDGESDESESDGAESGGAGGDGAGDGSSSYPGHEGHQLVIRE